MHLMNWLIALALLIAFVTLVLRERRSAQAPAFLLLRSLFPSWRFFEEIDPAPALSFRTAPAAGELGPWQQALPPIPRTPAALLLNARGNLRLAYQSLIERLADELDAQPEAELTESVSYRLVQRLVASQIGARGTAPFRYQFRLTAPDSGDEILISALHASDAEPRA